MELWKLLLVMLGGGLGALGRYLIGRLTTGPVTDAFPWHTLAINIVGSFLLNLLFTSLRQHPDRALWFAFLGTGLCGGFTTFSTFSVETVLLLEQNRLAAALAYVLASVLGALLGAWLGSRI